MAFVDEIVCVLASGKGGDGCVSFRREAHVPRGGPDGGDGGNGGALVLIASTRRNTLSDFRRNKRYQAENGHPGTGKQMYGRSGVDLEIEVPVGTVVHDAETNEILADLAEEGARYRLAGGAGGKGNIHFRSASRRTPRIATPGEPGVEKRVRLELRLIADVGLLGLPNAGKSTLIRKISRAHPKVAAYPFTTLVPHLGVVESEFGEKTFIVADIPGLIEGAADGVGLGHQFLRHVERCAVYLHLVASDEETPPEERLGQLDRELALYAKDLERRPQVVVLTKVDLLEGADRARHLAALEEAARPRRVFAISGLTGEGVAELLDATWEHIRTTRATA